MNKKNVLVLVQQFGQGGAEKVAAMLAQMLQDSGKYGVTFCALYAPDVLPELPGIEVCTLGIRPAGGIAGKLGNYRRALTALRRLKQRQKTALTISSLWPVDWMNALTGRERKIAIIQINILNNPQNTAMVKARPLVTAVYRRMDKIILGGSNLVEELRDFFRIPVEKLQVIHNAIDTALIRRNMAVPLPARLQQIFSGNKVFVSANRLAEIKNTDSLARIFPALSDGAGVKLLLIGEGEEKAAIEAGITAQSLRYCNVEDDGFDADADVFFLRFQKNIHNIISHSSAFLFPTKGEGLPLGLIEAMYCGAPVLVSDCPNGGVAEIMEGAHDPHRRQGEWRGGGYLMPIPLRTIEGSDGEWLIRMTELLHADEAKREGIAAHNRRRAADFSTDIINAHWHHLLEGMLHS